MQGGANDGGGKKSVHALHLSVNLTIPFRKKKKSKAKEDKSDIELAAKKEQIKERLKTNHNSLEQSNDSGSDRNSPALQGSSSKKTEAERRFEEVQRERVRLALFFRLFIIHTHHPH